MSYIQRIQSCNNATTDNYLPFFIDRRQTGWITTSFAENLHHWKEIFIIDNESVQLAESIQGFSTRSNVVDQVIQELVRINVIRSYLDEPYPVTAGDRSQAVMTIDRSAISHFGLRSFGQHLNGYVRKNNGIHLWIARRASDRYVAPGKLDNMVAGGLPWHISLEENLIKECAEEAGMSELLARQVQATGTVSYLAESANGIKPDTLYCYDIELPDDFTPVCTDGEVESFELMPVDKVMSIIHESTEFKENCNLVILDFLVRHGQLDPAMDNYGELVSSLHRKL